MSTTRDTRIAQLALSVDNLSCEMLAYAKKDHPLPITFYESSRMEAKRKGKELAVRYNCQYIEFEWGAYKLFRVKP